MWVDDEKKKLTGADAAPIRDEHGNGLDVGRAAQTRATAPRRRRHAEQSVFGILAHFQILFMETHHFFLNET